MLDTESLDNWRVIVEFGCVDSDFAVRPAFAFCFRI